MGRRLLFTGGYTEPILMGSGEIVEGRCEGIRCYAFDDERGTLSPMATTRGVQNPSYVLADRRGEHLYCVNELKTCGEVEGSMVSAYCIDNSTGALTLINRQATCGADACHLSLSRDDRWLLATNYSGGSFSTFPIREDGGIAPAACLLKHAGSGLNAARQGKPHPHQTILAPDDGHVYVSDLGLDTLKCSRADWEKGWLLPEPERDIYGRPGQGTRHGAFDAAGKHLYVMTELSAEVNVYDYDQRTGSATLAQTLACPTDGADEECLGAGIRLHPGGHWLYCAVRGVNRLYVYDVMADGRLHLSQVQASGGQTPREFALSPDGAWLLASHQDSDDIGIHAVNPKTGHLTLQSTYTDAPCVTTLCFV